MAITINWSTKVISVQKADMTLVQSVPNEVRQLDLNVFRLSLKDLEDDEAGMPFPRTHNNNPPVDVGGVTLARVIEIINGYTVTFEDGQYAVNLAGANSNVGDVVNLNQVSIRSANSAGLTYSKEMEDQSYTDARVWIDIDDGAVGTTYPLGTPPYPVDNLEDAKAIIAARSFSNRLHLHGDLTIGASEGFDGFDVKSSDPLLSSITFTLGCTTSAVHLHSISTTGTLDGQVGFEDCSMSDLLGFNGRLKDGGIDNTVTLANGTAHLFDNCKSVVSGDTKPIIDCDDLNDLRIQFRGYSGGLKIINYSGASNKMSIDLLAGGVWLDSTCTAGEILVRGVGDLVDESGAGCIVTHEGLNDPSVINSKLDNNFAVSAAGI